MSDIRNKLAGWFENLAHIIFNNRIKSLIIVLAIVLASSSQIPKLRLDLSSEGLLHKNDPVLQDYNSFLDQFGRDTFILIAIKQTDIFNQKFLKKLKALHEELEENVPYIEEITSLINARHTLGNGDELIVDDLFKNWPKNDDEMAKIEQLALANPMYKNLLISEDGTFTTIMIKTNNYTSLGQDVDVQEDFNEVNIVAKEDEKTDKKAQYITEAETNEAVIAVQNVLERYKGDDFPVYLAGFPAMNYFLGQAMFNDIRTFMALASITIVVFLFVMFRRISGVLLPLAVVILSLSSTIGIMAGTGIPLTVPTQIIPTFLMAVGVGAAVHILSIFYRHLNHTGDKEEAIAFALGHSGLPVVMTSITTACGLLSFSTADVAPIAHLGIFASIGVMISLVYSIIMLPALIAVIPIKPRQSGNDAKRSTLMDRFLTGIGNFSTGYPYQILIVCAIILVFSIVSASRIRFSHYPLRWLPETNQVRTAIEIIDHELRGSLNLDIVVDTGKENGLYDPEILSRLDKAEVEMESVMYDDVFVGKAVSIATILKEINQALNENRPEHYSIPQNRDLVAQEFLLFEGSGTDDLEDFVDTQFSKTRFSMKIPFKDAIKFNKLISIVTNYFEKEFPEADITLTGLMAILTRIMQNTITSMVKSYTIAFVVISVLMVFLIGGVRIGLLSMIPNIAPILLMLCLMNLLSLPMDLFAMMVGSIAIGLAVDDTIHFMYNFRRYYDEIGDPKAAVHETLQSTGRAMFVTTIVLSMGFFIYMFATLNNLFNFGLLTGFAISMALIADYFLAPALMVVVNKKKSIPSHMEQAHNSHNRYN